ncbi:MAG: hypothetical protein RR137_07990 [Odoribacter sp.]
MFLIVAILPPIIATQSFGNGLGIATFRSYSRRIPFVSSSFRNEGDTPRLHRGYDRNKMIIKRLLMEIYNRERADMEESYGWAKQKAYLQNLSKCISIVWLDK